MIEPDDGDAAMVAVATALGTVLVAK